MSKAEIISEEGNFYIRKKRSLFGFLSNFERYKFLKQAIMSNRSDWEYNFGDRTHFDTLEEAEQAWQDALEYWKEQEEFKKAKVVKRLKQ